MAKILYWHLTIDDVKNREYPTDKLVHWEIRTIINEESHLSIFWFRDGIPFDKEPINGIAMYGYEVEHNLVERMKDILHKELGGDILVRSHRIFLDKCNIRIDNKSIAELATKVSNELGYRSEIWLEFDNIDENYAKKLFNKPLIINK